jgi:hypothetical protein
MTNKETINKWTILSNNVLKGRTITEVRYLDDEEMQMMKWSKRPICFQLDNGTICFMSTDDEGNDGGSLFYQTNNKLDVLPTLR